MLVSITMNIVIVNVIPLEFVDCFSFWFQNSGLGNIVNPIMSLCVPSVYSVPVLLMIGWRGEPGKRDEPQHQIQGQTTPGLLGKISNCKAIF